MLVARQFLSSKIRNLYRGFSNLPVYYFLNLTSEFHKARAMYFCIFINMIALTHISFFFKLIAWNCWQLLAIYFFLEHLKLSQDGVILHASSNTILGPLTRLQKANYLVRRGGSRDGSR